MLSPLDSDNSFGAILDELKKAAWSEGESGNIKVAGNLSENCVGSSDTTISTLIKNKRLPQETFIIDKICKCLGCTEIEYIQLMGGYIHNYDKFYEKIPQQTLITLEEASKEFLKESSEPNKTTFYDVLKIAREYERTDAEVSVRETRERYERENYYYNLAYTPPFFYEDFIQGFEHLTSKGDGLLAKRQATAYDLIRSNFDEFYPDFLSDEPLIFYSNYLGRVREIARLLAEMEYLKIIVRDDTQPEGKVKFGIKASRKLPSKLVKQPLDKRVEIVLSFAPLNPNEALDIIEYLSRHTPSKIENMRATNGFPRSLLEKIFEETTMYYRVDGGTLLILQASPDAAFEEYHSKKIWIRKLPNA